MSYDNLLSGALGGVIVLILTPIISRVNYAFRTNKLRKSVLGFLNIAKPKMDRYIRDSEKGIKYLNEEDFNDENEGGMDFMPMLTSEVLKTYNKDDLLNVCIDQNTYSNLLVFNYCLEFLKREMPAEVCERYISMSQKHNEEKGYLTSEEQ